ISLLSGSKRFVTDEPKAYSDFTLWEAHKFSNSLIRFDISSINSMYLIYQILYVKPSSELLFSLLFMLPGHPVDLPEAASSNPPRSIIRQSSIVNRQSLIVNDYRSILPKVRMYGSQITSPNPFPRLKPGATIPGRSYRRCVCTALAVKS